MELLRMPRASENMVEGTVGEWLLAKGDSCESQTPVVEIITEKAQFELECEIGGTISEIFATSRSTVPVNFILAVLTENDEPHDTEEIKKENEKILSDHLKATIGEISIAAVGTRKKKSTGKVSATPRARRLAKTSGIKLEDVVDSLKIEGIVEEKHVKDYIANQ